MVWRNQKEKEKEKEKKRSARERKKASESWRGASACGGAFSAISTLRCSRRAERAITILASRNLFLCSELTYLSPLLHLSKYYLAVSAR